MTAEELKVKYLAAGEKVSKRINTINKILKQLKMEDEDKELLFNDYKNLASSIKDKYLRFVDANSVVSKYFEKKVDRTTNEDGSWNWNIEALEYNNKLEQLTDNFTKLFDVELILQGWEYKFNTQLNKEKAPKIGILWTFLTNWENNVRDWYIQNGKHLVNVKNEYHEIVYEWLQKQNYSNLDYQQKREVAKEWNKYVTSTFGYRPTSRLTAFDVDDWIANKRIDKLTLELANIKFNEIDDDIHYSYDNQFDKDSKKGQYELYRFDLEKLDKILAQEKINKYEDLVDRVTNVVGEILDVSNLEIGKQKGELNGVVYGKNGKCYVETIGAGGYNIQCFHYRVLVKPIK